MSSKDELLQWDEGCKAFDARDYEQALNLFEMSTCYQTDIAHPHIVPQPIADTSRIHFNMAISFANVNMIDEAISSLTRAVACDQYMAVGYFMRGVLFFKKNLIPEALADFTDSLTNLIPEALADFTDSLTYLRGNLLIDYTQLGMPYKLFSCEVSFNRGLCFAGVGQVEACMADFDDADRTRPIDGSDKGVDHRRIDEGLDLAERAIDYCRPFEVPLNIVFKPPAGKIKNTGRVDYLGKSKVVAAADDGDNFAGFSGTKIKMETLSRGGGKKTAGPLDEVSFSEAATLARNPPETLTYQTLTRTRTLADSRAQTLGRTGSTRSNNNVGPSPSMSRKMSADGGDMRGNGEMSMGRSGSSRGSPNRPVPPPPVERKNSDNDRGGDPPRFRSRTSSVSAARPNQSARDFYEEQMKPNGGGGGAGNFYEQQMMQRDADRSRGRSTDRYDNGRDTRSKSRDRYDDGLDRRNTQMSMTSSLTADKFKIKCHYNETLRIIVVPPNVTFDDLSSRIQKKFGSPQPLKLKYRDNDNEMVLMTDQEDLEIAFEMAGIEYGVPGAGGEKFEV
ncbi:hypothetical protein HDU76_006768, partial [Blyttiomyces sp. JEL0837]